VTRHDDDDWSLRKDLQAYLIKYQGTPHAERAYQALDRLPSPLDRFDPMDVGRRFEGDPLEVVLVLGDQETPVRKPRQSVAISPDGRLLAAGGEGFAIKVWNLLEHPPGQELLLKGHTDAVRLLSFSPDSQRLLSAAFGLDRTARVWDLGEGSEVLKVGGLRNSPSIAAVFSPDGQFVLAGGERNLSLWKVAETSMQRRFEESSMGMVFAVCYCPDGKRALAAGEDRKLHLWDVEQGKELLAFGGHEKAISGVTVALDGRTAFSGSEDGTIRAWDLATGEETRLMELEQSVVGLGLTLDGRLLGACGADGTVAFWDVPSLNPVRKLHMPGVGLSGLAFAPDGRHVAVATRHGRTVVLRLPR
jgi:WD40 repeat protein